jgi:hypothetical protein
MWIPVRSVQLLTGKRTSSILDMVNYRVDAVTTLQW